MALRDRPLILVAVGLTALAFAAGCGSDDDTASEAPSGSSTAQTEARTADERTRTATADEQPPPQANAEGRRIFDSSGCANCHTLAAAGANGKNAPSLDELRPSVAEAEEQIRNGGGGMPAFGGQLSDDEIRAVAEFVSRSAGSR